MSWYMRPEQRIITPETNLAQEAYQLLHLQVTAGTDIYPRLFQLLFNILHIHELEWLQNKFDQDNGDPRIFKLNRTDLGPIWPAPARRVLRYAIFNNKSRITEQQDPECETVMGADDFTTASLLTEDPNITIPLKTIYGMEFSSLKVPPTRLGMISKDVWILIEVDTYKNGHSLPHPRLPRTTDRHQLVYAKVLEPFHTLATVLLMKGVTMVWDENHPSYYPDQMISNLNEVILLKHILFRPSALLDRKMPSFEHEIQKIVSYEIQEFIGGPWYLADNSQEMVFK